MHLAALLLTGILLNDFYHYHFFFLYATETYNSISMFIKDSSDATRQSGATSFAPINDAADSTGAIIIVAISMTSVLTLGGFFFLKKRKEQ